MSKKRVKALERKLNPQQAFIQAYLPDWLKPEDYVAPVATPGEKIIKPSGFLAIQPDGSVRWHE